MDNNLIIDKQFKILAPRLTQEDYDILEENIFDNGCKEPIHIWKNIILDGHKRYEICQKWSLPFARKCHIFKTQHEAIAWICQKHAENPFLTEELRKYLIGKHYFAAREQFLLNHKSEDKLPGYYYRVAADLGILYHAATNTIYKYGGYAVDLDGIASKEPEMLERILSARLKISQKSIHELSQLPKEMLRNLNLNLSPSEVEHISYSELRHELQWKKLPQAPAKSAQPEQKDIAIKMTPKYDPDVDVSSLALTMPSWCSSIERTLKVSDLSLVSNAAKQKLQKQLMALDESIGKMLSAMEEVN